MYLSLFLYQVPIQEGDLPLKPTKVTSFTTILYNLKNSIRDMKPFCRPLFCHSSVVDYTSSLLKQRSHYDT